MTGPVRRLASYSTRTVLGGLVEGEVADAVDVAHLGEGEHGLLGGRGAVAVEDVKLGHRAILAAKTRARTTADLRG